MPGVVVLSTSHPSLPLLRSAVAESLRGRDESDDVERALVEAARLESMDAAAAAAAMPPPVRACVDMGFSREVAENAYTLFVSSAADADHDTVVASMLQYLYSGGG